jgi:hypothetical protein
VSVVLRRPAEGEAAPPHPLAIENVQRDFKTKTEVDKLGFAPLHDSLLEVGLMV